MIAWSALETPVGRLWLATTEAGVCRLGLPNETWEAFVAALRRVGDEMVEDRAALLPLATQLREYFAGQRRAFDVPLDLRGSDFQRAVWAELRAIPYGSVVTYGQIAQRLGRGPAAARAVGAAVGANPVSIVVPCHRVVGADGALTGYGGGLEMKTALLRLEGVLL